MAIDPSVIAGIKPPQLMTPADALNLKNMMYRSQLAQMQLAEAQRQISGRNALAQMLAQSRGAPGAGGMPQLQPDQVRNFLARNPQASDELLKLLSQQQSMAYRQAQERRAELDSRQKQDKEWAAIISPIERKAMSLWQEELAKPGADPNAALQRVQSYVNESLDSLEKSGVGFIDRIKAMRSMPFNPRTMGSMLMTHENLVRPATVGAQSDIAKLEEDLRAGRISQSDYAARKKKILEGTSSVSSFAKEMKDAGIKEGSPEWNAMWRKRLARETAPTTTMIQLGAGGAGGAGIPVKDQGKTGEEYLKTLSPADQREVRAIREGRINLTDIATAKGRREKVQNMVLQAYPDFDVNTSVSGFTPEAKELGSWKYLQFGTNMPGFGKTGARQRAEFVNGAAKIGRSLGLSYAEMSALPSDNKVKYKAIGNLTNWGAMMAKSQNQLDLSIQLAIGYAKKIDPTKLRTLNKLIIAGRTEFNDPIVNGYATAIQTIQREYGRVMSGPTSNAMLPVEAMKKSEDLLSTALDVKSLEEVAKVIKKDTKYTVDSVTMGIDSLRSSIPGLGGRKGSIVPPVNAKGWKLMTDKNGNRAYVSPDRKQFEEVK